MLILEENNLLKQSVDPSPASIPSHDGVFGYEETDNGKIIRQKPNKNTYTGKIKLIISRKRKW